MCAFYPSSWEAEASESLEFEASLGCHLEKLIYLLGHGNGSVSAMTYFWKSVDNLLELAV